MSETSHITDLEIAQGKIERLSEELRNSTAEATNAREAIHSKMQEFAREFRVPLTTILGFSDMLSAKDKAHMTEWNQIAIAGHQLMELIKGLERPIDAGSQSTETAENISQEPKRIDRTILHIEDNETNFRLSERILEDRPNVELLWASSGQRGLESAIRHKPAMILLDLNLPDIHGSDVLTRLRENPATNQIPVVILSADASPTRIEKMLQSGARHYLVKPFDINKFLYVVDEALRAPEPVAV